MGTIVAIANHKGGSGRTTTAINLGACLAARGRKTLLADLDPQANATLGLGVSVPADGLSVYHALMGDVPVEDVIRKTDLFGLEILPATLGLAVVEERGSPPAEHEFTVRKVLRPLKETYHYIILDIPPSRGMLMANALLAAEKLLVPVQCEYYALKGAGQFLETLTRYHERFQTKPEITGAFLTMHERWQKLSQEVEKQLRRTFPGYIFETVIPRSVALAEAPSRGKAIVQYAPGSPGALAYRQLADEFLRREEGEKSPEPALGKMKRWWKQLPVIERLFGRAAPSESGGPSR